jgi:hypothetical protein
MLLRMPTTDELLDALRSPDRATRAGAAEQLRTAILTQNVRRGHGDDDFAAMVEVLQGTAGITP